MSEQKTNYMAELDRWTQSPVIAPLEEFDPLADGANVGGFEALVERIKKAIREKVRESYGNGLKAQAKPARKEWHSYAKAQTR